VNIDNIFKIIPPEYAAGKWVIFFIGLKNIIEIATGINSVIILTSRHYKLYTLFIFIFLVILVALFIILIPAYGLSGAAISILISFSIFSLIRHYFLKIKYKMVAFNYKILIVLIIGGVSYLAGYLMPLQENYINDLVIRSIVSGGLYSVLIVFLRVSEDVNLTLNSIFKTNFFWNK
jgi:O-antigen/teichoic acid export membrane protein